MASADSKRQSLGNKKQHSAIGRCLLRVFRMKKKMPPCLIAIVLEMLFPTCKQQHVNTQSGASDTFFFPF